MALLKTRPKVRLRVPNEIRPGHAFTATVLLDCKREVPVEFVKVRLSGIETWTVGSGKHSTTRKHALVNLGAQLSGERTLSAGRHELPVKIPLPPDLPPSYQGRAGRIEYELDVHVSVPWWPDRRSQFEIHVVPLERPSPPSNPQIYSSRVEGPREREPHAEMSVSASWTRSGDVVRGAFALSNVEHNRYSEATVGLVGTEVLYNGPHTYRQLEYMRYRIRVGLEEAQEGEMLPFQFRLPVDAMSQLDRKKRGGLVSLRWELELRVGIRWGQDLILRVPFQVLPRSSRPGDAPARLAPPVVGSDRLKELWQRIGEPHGLVYGLQTLTRAFGETQLVIRREHMGRDGIHLIAELRYPELHMALEIEPAKGLKMMGGVRVGFDDWDRAHHVLARDPEQAITMLKGLVPRMTGPTVRRMDDERLLLSFRDAGQKPAVLTRFVASAVHLGEYVEALRHNLPPPSGLEAALPEWQDLARRISGTLETARMRITGQAGAMQTEVRVAFDKKGNAMCTWLTVAPSTPLDQEQVFAWHASSGALETPRSGEAGELIRATANGVEELSIERDRISVRLGLLGIDAGVNAVSVEQKLSRMARLVQVLRGEAGPYR
ncbi:MAG: hypothetical protein AB8I08_33685 [Sandaracinaceae bacterium]